MRRTGNRVFRDRFTRAEETADEIVFPVTRRGDTYHFPEGNHGVDIRAHSLNLLLILHHDHVIARDAHFFIFGDAQCFQQ